MADPKYANLPGLAPDDEPDTYETDDRPEAEQDLWIEDESENVEKLHVSTSEAFEKFKDKNLDGKKADFSDRLRRGRNTGYAARTGQWELAGEGQPETVVQKYQRLQLELQQLDQEIADLQSGLKPDSGAEERSAAQLGSEMDALHGHLAEVNLEQLLGAQVLSELGDPQGALRSKLEQQLSQLAGGAGGAVTKPASGAGDASATYELHLRPEKARAQQAAALGELEKRLERMERAVGAAPDKMSRLSAETRQRSLLSAVAALSSKVALLEPATLEAAEARLQALHQRMNQLSEQRQAGVDAEKMTKISELHELMQRTAGVQGELPVILDRLTSLQGLHDHALNFSRSLTQLEAAQQKIDAGLGQGEARLAQVQADCAASLSTLTKGLDALTARLDAVKK
ncbi:Dynactin subunit 2-A [Amphibalanus amphitrite]|uniref:Dynactin subunit 2-A n=1 Tax=Amphibalanus amphitrite TaxID=1232801 RepID=A0A6A4WA09_AMPAM|nr:dynactin subunit 2-like [Amphibalanus amphitrite]XP_043229665.1 dynactin subunit 2-like [Amphibalanus amphitrite]XP_043229667.1 dynactin subunit 2-like [Amphibalanus amphitrite]XP_043229668.1 dynactin subunit 2-like [Amphibalanus amphitrite]XP_043229669.1 dynactin subunit 2-like [Amphibalanus amphitrite]XP_043229670.1 dynactin subunit 2-like [Amphibalanus amphitrite]XP_043229671.1 dynactin subunit 2-like [Amphibalanus amphitrite]XP_043229672.1 dynactin subunit 2-like [Amphibalanus amphitr